MGVAIGVLMGFSIVVLNGGRAGGCFGGCVGGCVNW